jgi:trimethylamine--corrinoid protein Co-methyltransferase
MPRKRYPDPRGLPGGQYRPLSDEQLQRIHRAALTILERTGVQVEEPEACRLFQDAGAVVSGERIRLPPALVEDALDWAPKRVVLAGRDPHWDLELTGSRVHIGTGGAALTVWDLETGEPRPALLCLFCHQPAASHSH